MHSSSRRALILSSLLAAGMGYYYFGLFLPYAHAKLDTAGLGNGYRYGCDLYPIWLTSRGLKHGVNPYTIETTKEIQRGLYGRTLGPGNPGDPPENYRAFAYPLYVDLPAFAIAPIPFPLVQVVGSIVFPLLIFAGFGLWLRFLQLNLSTTFLLCFATLMVVSYPVLEGLYAQQPSVLVAFLIAGAATALTRNLQILSGTLLAMASIKPQLMLLVGLWLVLWAVSDFTHRKKWMISFVLSIVLLSLASELLVPGWTRNWIRYLLDYRQYTDPPLPQFAFGTVIGNIFSLALLATAAFVGVRARREKAGSARFITATAFLLAVTVLIAPSSIAVYDQLLLIPAILWLYSRNTEIFFTGIPLRILGYAGLVALFWQWIAACAVAIGTVVHPGISQTRLVLAPLRMAASVPFAVVALWLFLLWKGTLTTSAKSPAPSG